MAKVFRVTVVLFVVIVSVVLVGVLITGVMSLFGPALMTDSHGIAAVAGGVSERWLRLALRAGVLFVNLYLFFRRRKSR